MPLTKIETKHTFNGSNHAVVLAFDKLDDYYVSTNDEATIVDDNVFMSPFRFDINYPTTGTDVDQRSGKKINAKNIKVMFKTSIPATYDLGPSRLANALYYTTKGVSGFVQTPWTNISSTGTATQQTLSLTGGQGTYNGLQSFPAGGNFYQNGTITGTATAQDLTLSTPISVPQFVSIPGHKLKMNFRVLIVQAEPDYFNDSTGLFSSHKVLTWFIKNRIWLGSQSEPITDNKYSLKNISNTDNILRESSDYSGTYRIVYDHVIRHSVGGDSMTTIDIPVNQELTFAADELTPTNRKFYHILVIPPLTNKPLSGVYQYDRLPALSITETPAAQNVIHSYFNGLKLLNPYDVSETGTAETGTAFFNLDFNVKFTFLDF